MTFILTSEDFADGDYLDERHVLSNAYGFGCAGGNASPQLSWRGAPEGTGSFALTCYDPRRAHRQRFLALARGQYPR